MVEYNFAFMLKTYFKDIEYVRRLLKSYYTFNKENIPLYIVVDQRERIFFEKEVSYQQSVFLINKEDIPTEYADEPVNGISEGYINQEIVKLSFWKLGLCKNYSCIDSELEFIRTFTVDEFMYDEDTPYSVLIEDHDLQVNPHYYEMYWKARQKSLNHIKEELGVTDKHIMTCHGMQTFNSGVLLDMEQKFMIPRGYSYLDLLRISPYEFSWYNYYLQQYRPIPIHPCEPLFKTYHMPYQQVVDVISGVSINSLKRAYAGVILNSNYSRDTTGQYADIVNLDFFVGDKKVIAELKRILWRSEWKLFKFAVKRLLVKLNIKI